ncbi:hypothetical protein ACMX25_17120 [Caballeronia sp. 15715]|uniref:hypothetical protein n=1 Tax=Caballeronia sp. 15715 TaxID=3391030 RepID=UPI0039E46ECC
MTQGEVAATLPNGVLSAPFGNYALFHGSVSVALKESSGIRNSLIPPRVHGPKANSVRRSAWPSTPVG